MSSGGGGYGPHSPRSSPSKPAVQYFISPKAMGRSVLASGDPGSAQWAAVHDRRVHHIARARIRRRCCGNRRGHPAANGRCDPPGVELASLSGDLRQAHRRAAVSGSNQAPGFSRTAHDATCSRCEGDALISAGIEVEVHLDLMVERELDDLLEAVADELQPTSGAGLRRAVPVRHRQLDAGLSQGSVARHHTDETSDGCQVVTTVPNTGTSSAARGSSTDGARFR